MAGRIRDEDIALVRERARIDDVVREYVTLKSAGGGSLKGLCPFHDERSPSFHVTPSRGMWYCFGCGEGGDVLGFLQKIDHLSFAESVEKLADKTGVELRYVDGGAAINRQQGQRTRLVEAHKLAAKFYVEQLATPDAQIARDFLTSRGFDAEAAKSFGVGYAPKSWDALTNTLRKQGFTDAELLAGGLLSQGNRGAYDRFRGRLVWPIRELGGDVIGFGARKLYDDDDGPKYLNTPETPIYKKSQVLYGLDMARKEVSKQQQAVIVEGYTDVMACHLAGITTAVATCGTAFGSEHIKVLRRLLMDDDQMRGEVVFTFDGDAAGQKAALRAFDEDQRFVANTFVAVEPSGMDPCDLRLAKGDEAVVALVDHRVPLFQFAIKSILAAHDLDRAEGRIAALREAAPVVAKIKDAALRPEYTRL
ncbi:MAG: DNA primase, partial [Actinomycetota bacterium]|nr:DNA primase [Actinomycetota bacterium]